MGKQKTSDDGKGKKAKDGDAKQNREIALPRIGGQKQPRTLPAAHVLVSDQVLLYPDALTASECTALIAMFDTTGSERTPRTMVASPPAKKGEAERTNFRFSTTAPDFAKQLYEATGLSCAVAGWQSMFPRSGARPIGLSSNIRIYRYDPGAHFACHYDDHSTDPHFGPGWGRTEWTLLVYLSGEPDVQGGQTVFYKGHVRPKNGMQSENAIVVPLQKGAALLHRHGKVCMLHEALPPTRGTKWVLRSDLIFGGSPP